MTIESLSGWVLHKRLSGDSSLLVTFFTREKGIVCATYKGGRTPRKQALVSVFTPIWLSTNLVQDRYFVRQLETTQPTLCLSGDALFSALYVNELLYHILHPLDESPEVYDCYEHTVQALAQITERVVIEPVLRRFEWQLLVTLGYQMSLTHDARSSYPISETQQYVFILGEGFVLTEKGVLGKHIIEWSNGKFNDVTVRRLAKSVMRCVFNHLLEGRPIKARQLYRTHFA
jgi:DNA repair protein RecO (recombination protein O)